MQLKIVNIKPTKPKHDINHKKLKLNNKVILKQATVCIYAFNGDCSQSIIYIW